MANIHDILTRRGTAAAAVQVIMELSRPLRCNIEQGSVAEQSYMHNIVQVQFQICLCLYFILFCS